MGAEGCRSGIGDVRRRDEPRPHPLPLGGFQHGFQVGRVGPDGNGSEERSSAGRQRGGARRASRHDMAVASGIDEACHGELPHRQLAPGEVGKRPVLDARPVGDHHDEVSGRQPARSLGGAGPRSKRGERDEPERRTGRSGH